jgi:hypothetical protein
MNDLLRAAQGMGTGQGLLEDFIAGALSLWEIALFAAAVAALLFILSVVFTKDMSWHKKRASVFGMLYGMKDRERVWLSGQISRQIFVTAVVCLGIRPGLPHMLLYAGIFAIEAFSLPFPSLGRLLFSFVNNAVIFGAVLVTDMLYGFLHEVRDDNRILLIFVLMALFVVLYTLYFTLRDLSGLLERKNRADLASPPARRGGAS